MYYLIHSKIPYLLSYRLKYTGVSRIFIFILAIVDRRLLLESDC